MEWFCFIYILFALSIATSKAEPDDCVAEPIRLAPNKTSLLEHNVTSAALPCMWSVVADNATRIRATARQLPVGCDVTFYDAHGGLTGDDVIRVVLAGDASGSHTAHVSSRSSNMWIAVACGGDHGDLRIDLMQYTDVECAENQFACPSGLDCLDDVLQVCDARRDCIHGGDELGCGDCTLTEFRCARSDECVSRDKICNGAVDCTDLSDELLCGNCGAELVRLAPKQTYQLEHSVTSAALPCLWVIVAKNSSRIEVTVRKLSPGCDVTFYDAYGLSTGDDVIRVVRGLEAPGTYSGHVTSTSSSMWILQTCENAGGLRVKINQFMKVECAENQFACPSGLDCLVDVSQVCDGRRDCLAGGDELGCEPCGIIEFRCSTSGLCIPSDKVCNGFADCEDLSDEFLCGYCEAELVHLAPNRTHRIDMITTSNVDCLRVVVAEPGIRIRADVTNHPYSVCDVTISSAHAPYGNASVGRVLWISPQHLNDRTAHHHATSDGHVMRVVDLRASIYWCKAPNQFIVNLSQFEEVECAENQFACPSGLDCLDDVSQVCDGCRQCLAGGDELGCGDCNWDEFRCSTSGNCVPHLNVCDGTGDCEDLSDEFLCGFCGTELIYLEPGQTFHLLGFAIADCLWVVVAEPGTIVQATILHDPQTYALTFYSTAAPHGSASRAFALQPFPLGPQDFPGRERVISNSSIMWVTKTGMIFIDPVEIQFEEHEAIECSNDQIPCLLSPDCIDQSLVCDGRLHCPVKTDELGCGTCGKNEFRCFTSGNCLSRDHVCNKRRECSDTSDEFSCGHCGTDLIYLVPNQTYHFELEFHGSLDCVWVFVSEPGKRVRFDIRRRDVHPWFRIWFFSEHVPYGNWSNDGRHFVPETSDALIVSDTSFLRVESGGSWAPTSGFFAADVSQFTPIECPDNQLACPSGLNCLDDVSQVCDGRRDCLSGSDELGCGECEQDEFQCTTSALCVRRGYVCDSEEDCGDLSDEYLCGLCGRELFYLGPFENVLFTDVGKNRVCLWVVVAEPGMRVLASIELLPDESSIAFYSARTTFGNTSGNALIRIVSSFWIFPATLTSDTQYMRLEKRGLSLTWPDWSSVTLIKLQQYNVTECSSTEFMCPSGLSCTQRSAVCDGRPDCKDYGDEFGCGNCSQSQFTCSSGLCISHARICDGVKDCPDFSDEFDCGPCGGKFIDFTHGATLPTMLTSPEWPDTIFHNKLDCLWLLIAEEGHAIVLRFIELRLGNAHTLRCGNGGGSEDAFIVLTGNTFPSVVESRDNKMFLKFARTMSSFRSEKDFLIEVEHSLPGTVSCAEDEVICELDNLVCAPNGSSIETHPFCFRVECGQQVYLTGDDQHYDLTSPNYPFNYPPRLDCYWGVVSTSIQVTVNDFTTEFSRDKLRLTGDTLHGGREITFELHGTTKLRTISFNSQKVHIRFASDSTVSYSGFHLRLSNNFTATDATSCPDDNLFDCRDGSCLVPDARCNGFQDCQTNGLDELDCVVITCPEFYHCNNTTMCIQWSLVCDGKPDCPNADDETDEECEQRCPSDCACSVQESDVHVDCGGSWEELIFVDLMKKVQHLELTGGNVSSFAEGVFKGFPYMQTLRLNNNSIDRLKPGTFDGLDSLTHLDISANSITTIESDTFQELRSLEIMIASDIPLRVVKRAAFDGLKNLRTMILIRGSKSSNKLVAVEDNALTDLVSLRKLFVDDYRLCCEFVTVLDGFQVEDCMTTERQPPLNLCGSLMRNHLLRISMWSLGLSALIGNMVVILWRLSGKEKGGKKTHSFFVLNLAVSDFMMGAYMLIIAVADAYFGETYSRVANEWRSGAVCKVAGVISVLSSEASVFFVTLISLDCFYCIAFPFSRVKLEETTAHVLVALIWVCSMGLSIGPTVFVGADSKVYGLSDVCIGLPLLTKPTSFVIEESRIGNSSGTGTVSIPVGQGKEPAWIYSIVLFLGVNLLCFVLVLGAYVGIFVSVKRSGSKVQKSSTRQREIRMAVKMALIVGTDFACWMPVIVMGILSQTGLVDISPDMYAWIVVFILPINSSLNPYLYTFFTTLTACRARKADTAKKDNTIRSKSSATQVSTLPESSGQ